NSRAWLVLPALGAEAEPHVSDSTRFAIGQHHLRFLAKLIAERVHLVTLRVRESDAHHAHGLEGQQLTRLRSPIAVPVGPERELREDGILRVDHSIAVGIVLRERVEADVARSTIGQACTIAEELSITFDDSISIDVVDEEHVGAGLLYPAGSLCRSGCEKVEHDALFGARQVQTISVEVDDERSPVNGALTHIT